MLDLKSQEALTRLLGVLWYMKLQLTMYHWFTDNSADHVLFEKLAVRVGEDLDLLAERMVGLSQGSLGNMLTEYGAQEIILQVSQDLFDQGDEQIFRERCLNLQAHFQKELGIVYESLEEESFLTLGLDDLLQGLASRHEQNKYLILQISA